MRPAVTFFDPRRCEIPFYVQKIEDAGDLSGLNIFLGLERLDLPRMRIGGGPSRDATVFTEETFTKVAEVYAEDVQAFGYSDLMRRELKY